ncbi:MAG: hypothetical protein IJR80_01280 [Treponema sp.]|nr:hypothetical protein [Treponema sp.]
MKSIFINTVKISAAAIFAVLCAQAMGLDFSVSAGIVAILSVQPTKKETLRTALARLLAFAAALVISITLFNLLGVGFGILVNIFLHKKTNYIEELKSKTDNQIKLVLARIAARIKNPALPDYDGSCFTSLNQSIFTAKKQAEENFNNQFSKKDTFDSRYLEMRENQTKILYEMYKAASKIRDVPSTASLLSDFLEKVATEYHKDNDVKSLLEELALISEKMKTLPLPQSRAEFEDRANLFILMERLQDFLQIKRDFML